MNATRDAALTIGLAVAFATLLAAHVATLFGLARNRYIGATLVGLVLPPVAPFWAFIRGMRGRAILWIASAALYVVALVLAVRS
jgi:hypothetical protein